MYTPDLPAFMSDLNDEQRAAVEHPLGSPAVLIAGAGSGKTKCLQSRVVWLISKGVPPNKVLVVTFTNKASKEISDRVIRALPELETSFQPMPRTSTIHSLALSAIRKNPTGFGLQEKVTPLDDYDQSQMIRRIVDRTVDVKAKGISLSSYVYGLLEKIEFHRARGLGFAVDYTEEVHERALVEHAGYHALTEFDLQIWKLYEKEKTCQPPGTRVRVVTSKAWSGGKAGVKGFKPAETVDKPIEQLVDGDCVVSWRRQDGRTLFAGRPIRVASRHYCGRMLVVSCDNITTKVTPDHRMWVRFNDNAKGKHFVYLMYRNGFGFRVGISQFKYGKGTGLSSRMAGEGGEKAWVLRICDSQFEARCWEATYSMRYGIPQSAFNPNPKNPELYATLIKMIFNEANPEGARKCLKDHGLLEEFPLLVKDRDHWYSHSAHRFFMVAACNLIPEYMNLPKTTRAVWPKGGGNQQAWRIPEGIPITSIVEEQYEGRVYSLDVEKDHTYVADGLIVGNCMNNLDFSDMLCCFNRRVEQDPVWRVQLQKSFDVVLVDEAQDLSIPQWGVVNGVIALSNPNLMCVGDLSQSIMGFNGSAPHLLKEFSENWRGVTPHLYRIARNHRSLPKVVYLANKIQASMVDTIPLKMATFRGDEENKGTIELTQASLPSDVAIIIASEISKDSQRKRDNIPFKDNAILVRSARQIMDIESALVRYRIPYVVRGGKGLLQTEEIRDVISYLRLVTNPKDFTALVRAVGVPKRGVGDVALEKIRKVAQEEHEGDLIAASASVDKLSLFAQSLQNIQRFLDYPIQALDQIIVYMDYKKYIENKYKKEPDKVKSKMENIDRFKELVRGLSEDQKMSTEDLVFQITLERAREDDKEGQVTISTIHSAKGLEWKRVYVFGVVEGSLPHTFSMGSAEEIEEEKRLLYVACTRPQDSLTLCVHAMEQRGADTRRVAPSRFLIDLGIIDP
jgi:DNA helicase-2/ATP-dependent DNA helicase PcrA